MHLNGFSHLCGLMCYQVIWCLEALVTLCALEWLLSCVGPLMFLQVPSYSLSGPILRSSCQISSISKAYLLCGSSNAPSRTWSWKTLVTLCAHEWLFSRVGPLIFLQVASYSEPLVTLWAFERLLSCVGPLILVQRTWSWEALVTLYLLEWHLSSVGPLMFL